MPISRLTIDQLEDSLGLPIVIYTALDATTKQYVTLRLRDLPLGAIAVVVQWLNDRLATP